ncbi:MAG: hypothetical protein WBD40_16010 [Tepidisphaeraceae bacterium]
MPIDTCARSATSVMEISPSRRFRFAFAFRGFVVPARLLTRGTCARADRDVPGVKSV